MCCLTKTPSSTAGRHLNEDRTAQMDELVAQTSLDPTQAKNEKALEDEKNPLLRASLGV